MSLTKILLPDNLKFTPASAGVNWTRIQTLVHGPGAGDAYKSDKGDANSAVFACLMAIASSFPEAPIRVYRQMEEGKEDPLPDHPLQELLDNPTPNGELTSEEMMFWTVWALHTDGNAYWLKVRAGNDVSGNVVELWPISPNVIEPVSEGGEWLSYYRWQRGPNEFVNVERENIVQFRMGIDDRDHRVGLSPLKRLTRQISTDAEADKFTDTLLKNYAVPGLIVVPAAGQYINQDDADRIATSMRRKFGNDQRGNTAVLSKEAHVQEFGFSPEQLDLATLHRLPEERIAAVMGVPAIIAGLGAGLERATYSNFREAREMFTEQKLVPLWRRTASTIDTALKPDFDSSEDVFCQFDITSVRALQEDEDRKYARLNIGVQGMRPWITVNEARTQVGLPPIEGGDELQAQPPPQFSPNGDRRDEDDESGDEDELNRNAWGGANGQDAPFPRWESYP